VVRQQQRDTDRNALWQKTWRIQHEYLHWVRKWIYHNVKNAEEEILAYHPKASPRRVHQALLRSFRELIDPMLVSEQALIAFAQFSSDYTALVFADLLRGQPNLRRSWLVTLWGEPYICDLGDRSMLSCFRDFGSDTALLNLVRALLCTVLHLGWSGKQPALVFVMPNLIPVIGQTAFWAVLPGASAGSRRKINQKGLRRDISPSVDVPANSALSAGMKGRIIPPISRNSLADSA
jgi:hypothetical protein